MSILSFERYYIYSDFIADKLYPTWKNNYTKLFTIGMLRTDFIYQYKFNSNYQNIKKTILGKLQGNYIVALHLPVPGSYLFREEDVIRWMHCFEKILLSNRRLYFVLFPRRPENSPLYFNKLINRLRLTGRAEVSSHLVPEWKASYPWTLVCNLVVGCTYSDTVYEAWSVGTPAVSYSDIGKGRAEFEKFDENLRLYDCQEFEKLLLNVSKGKWPPLSLTSNIQKNVTGVAKGDGYLRLSESLEELVDYRHNSVSI